MSQKTKAKGQSIIGPIIGLIIGLGGLMALGAFIFGPEAVFMGLILILIIVVLLSAVGLGAYFNGRATRSGAQIVLDTLGANSSENNTLLSMVSRMLGDIQKMTKNQQVYIASGNSQPTTILPPQKYPPVGQLPASGSESVPENPIVDGDFTIDNV